MTHYKVFRRLRNGALQSAGEMAKSMRQTYQRQGWNMPRIPGSRIFVFDSLNSAEHFRGNRERGIEEGSHDVFEIWEVEAVNPKLFERLPAVWGFATTDEEIKTNWTNLNRLFDELQKFWKQGPDSVSFSVAECYSDVYGAEKIRLVKKIS